MKISIFWFRRDLRLKDNVGLHFALQGKNPVLPLFIFDEDILEKLPRNDARLTFIHETLEGINSELKKHNSSVHSRHGKPLEVWKKLTEEFDIETVFTNKDYEPYAVKRDREISEFLAKKGIELSFHKDQVIFEENEVTKDDGKPYTVYTPYKNKWLKQFDKNMFKPLIDTDYSRFLNTESKLHSLAELGFKNSTIRVKKWTLEELKNYQIHRDFPAKDGTSYLSVHLRFGTVNPRQIIERLDPEDATFLSELIWREFFMQILFHFPQVLTQSFRPKYDFIKWRNNQEEFKKWCAGETGYPMVDAGMRQLNETGYMHNRVRMVVASFLCKHLLIDWRWGEAYFAEKLLDYDLSANNGNWQWSAGTGCDAAPYFRIFNPHEQLKKFDKGLIYVRKWVKDFNELTYAQPLVEHKAARERALKVYKEGLEIAANA